MIAVAVAAQLLMGFPQGRLDSRAARIVVAAVYVDVTVVQVTMLLFMDYQTWTGRGCPWWPLRRSPWASWRAMSFNGGLMLRSGSGICCSCAGQGEES